MNYLFCFDLDHTLIDTIGVYRELRKSISDELKIDPEKFDTTYDSYDTSKRLYNPIDHIRLLSSDSSLQKNAIDAYMKALRHSTHIIFHDSLESMKRLSRFGNIVIVSQGEKEFQIEKVRVFDLNSFCKNVFVVNNKSSEEIHVAIQNVGKPDLVFSIGDRVSDARAFKEYSSYSQVPVITIRIRRPEGKYYHEEDVEGFVDFEYPDIVTFVEDFEKGKFNG